MEKRKAEPGSITQWISTCQCDELKPDWQDDSVAEQILLCTVCNKRIAAAGRVGSLTQWVFRSDLCACKTPSPSGFSPHSSTRSVQPSASSQDNSNNVYTNDISLEVDSIYVDPEKFPSDRYLALSEVGRGASGIVYRAIDKMLQKEIAIKCLNSVAANELMAFQKEAQATSRLNHPNIVKVFDFGATSIGAPYMVMEFANGISLKRLIENHGPLSEEEALPLTLNIVRALEHAHSKGIFHRDIKSSNVMVSESTDATEQLNVRLIDFGVAALKGVESPVGNKTILVGTPPYMSPEQLGGKPFDARSEVYSVGCLFYEILTGNPPFLGSTALETLNMHANQRVKRLSEVLPDGSFSDDVEQIVQRCLAKRPDQRFQSMRELAAQLESVSNDSATLFTLEPEGADTGGGVKAEAGMKVSTVAALVTGIAVLCIGAGSILFSRLAPFSNREAAPVKLPTNTANQSLMERSPMDWASSESTEEEFFFRTDRAGITFGNDKSLDELANRKSVKYLRLSRCRITEEGAVKLLPLKLTSLIIDNTTCDAGALSTIGRLTTINDLAVIHCKWFTGQAFRQFENLPLTDLRLEDCDLRDSSMDFLNKQKNLQRLFIVKNSQFTGSNLTELAGCPKLSRLHLCDLPALSDQCFFQIATLPSINILEFENSIFMPGNPRDDIEAALGGAKAKPYDVQAFEKIASMKRVSVLALDSDRLEDKHFDALVKMHSLQNLSLVGRQFIKPTNIEKLSKIPTLQIFKVIGPCLESGGIKQICAMRNIRRLVLCDCELSNKSMMEFPRSSVGHLIIDGENTITGVGLDYIARMPNLLLLRLPTDSYINPTDWKRFRAKNPRCQILRTKE